MMQYLVILLDDTSVSFCHCDNPYKERRLISLDDLRAGILYGMKENLMIQFVYPDYELPKEYLEAIDTIDHHDIKPYPMEGDVAVLCNIESIRDITQKDDTVYVIKTRKSELFNSGDVVADALRKLKRLNIVITDIETFIDEDLKRYETLLNQLVDALKTEYLNGKQPQLNLLTDRMMLDKANHCNAGVENITLAPNGKFYICPAFYYSDKNSYVGDLVTGVEIKNQQLLKLDYSPLCRHCDAYHCRRCVWLNTKTTLEMNTPSREQCIVAHTERNASRKLLAAIRENAESMPEKEIKEINYIDPFEVRKEW